MAWSKDAFLLVLLILCSIANSARTLSRSIFNLKEFASELKDSYDYVVIGGGTSGLTVAARLTEDPTKSVLVIEYGYLRDNDSIILLPASSTTGSRDEDQFYITSVPQPGLNNQTGVLRAGAVVGGSSAVNGQFFDRASSEDYDDWARLGNPGWDWNGLLPYFKKSTNFTPPNQELQTDFGTTFNMSFYGHGPIQASYPPWQYPGQKVQWAAWVEMGLEATKEISSGNKFGVLWGPSSQDPNTQTRSYAKTGYYNPAEKRSNYHLIVLHKVLNITFSDDLRATGVTFVSRNTTNSTGIHVIARKEVILAAGAVHSPQILQRSGIGPKWLLDEAKIETRLDLAGVGQNFQEHSYLFFAFDYKTDLTPNPGMMVPNTTFYDSAWAEYYANRTGPATFGRGNSVVFIPLQTIFPNWVNIVSAVKDQDASSYLPASYDSHLLAGYQAQRDLIIRHYESTNTSVMESPFRAGAGNSIAFLKPLSRGSININTTDPYGEVVLDFKTFANSIDLEISVAIFKFIRKWLQTPAHQKLGPVESATTANATSDKEIADMLRRLTNPSFSHPCGTTAMLPREMGGVVSPDLKVYGTEGLRVVDAGIIPLIPGTHLSATVYAIAEKAADIIKQDAGGNQVK